MFLLVGQSQSDDHSLIQRSERSDVYLTAYQIWLDTSSMKDCFRSFIFEYFDWPDSRWGLSIMRWRMPFVQVCEDHWVLIISLGCLARASTWSPFWSGVGDTLVLWWNEITVFWRIAVWYIFDPLRPEHLGVNFDDRFCDLLAFAAHKPMIISILNDRPEFVFDDLLIRHFAWGRAIKVAFALVNSLLRPIWWSSNNSAVWESWCVHICLPNLIWSGHHEPLAWLLQSC